MYWVIIRMVVDLPAPFGPTKPTTSPRSTEGHLGHRDYAAESLGNSLEREECHGQRLSALGVSAVVGGRCPSAVGRWFNPPLPRGDPAAQVPVFVTHAPRSVTRGGALGPLNETGRSHVRCARAY